MADSGSDGPGKIAYLYTFCLIVVVILLVEPDLLFHHPFIALMLLLLFGIVVIMWIVSPLLDSDFTDKLYRRGIARSESRRPQQYLPTEQPLENYSSHIDWSNNHQPSDEH